LLGDEIKGEEEFNEELRAKKGTVDTAPFESKNVFGANESSTNLGEDLGFEGDTADGPDFDDDGKADPEGQNGFRQSVLVGFRKHGDIKYEDFKLIMMLGRGTFGKVFLAELTKQNKLYAIKAIRKDVLIEYNQVQNTKLEKDILFSCDHPFLVGMDYLF
jgi:hypothetical protein